MSRKLTVPQQLALVRAVLEPTHFGSCTFRMLREGYLLRDSAHVYLTPAGAELLVDVISRMNNIVIARSKLA